MSKRKAGAQEHACPLDALAKHAEHCRVVTATSAFKPTWELCSQPHRLDSFKPCVPVGAFPAVRDVAASVEHRAKFSLPSAIGSFQRVRTGSDNAWEASLETRMAAAIRKWQGIVMMAPGEFDLGRRVSKDRPLGETLSQGLRHVFSGRAAETLHARANPILRFAKWCGDNLLQPFPLQERVVYAFCCAMEHACSAPTFLNSFLTSLRFAHYVMGMLCALDCANSPRVAGVSRTMFLSKKKLRQRPPLTVAMLLALEKLTCDSDASALDRVIAGFFVLLVLARARFSDGLNLLHLREEIPASASRGSLAGYVEANVSRTKAAYTVQRKTMFLPVVAPRHGVSGLDWFRGFQEARKASHVPEGNGIPVLPCRVSSGGWGNVPPSASVGASWLRGLLQKQGFSYDDVSPIGTHSCKATGLSWAAKYGLSPSVKRALGYHTAKEDRISHVYSRDAIASPIRDFEKVLEEIRACSFCPDETRSGYFPTEEDLADSGTEDSADEEDEVEDQPHLEEAIDSHVQPWAEVDLDPSDSQHGLVRNKTSRVIHLVADEGGSHVKCGRALTRNFVRLDKAPCFLWPMCRKCKP